MIVLPRTCPAKSPNDSLPRQEFATPHCRMPHPRMCGSHGRGRTDRGGVPSVSPRRGDGDREDEKSRASRGHIVFRYLQGNHHESGVSRNHRPGIDRKKAHRLGWALPWYETQLTTVGGRSLAPGHTRPRTMQPGGARAYEGAPAMQEAADRVSPDRPEPDDEPAAPANVLTSGDRLSAATSRRDALKCSDSASRSGTPR